ncbi:MAG: PDZ domain-containing protein, partial [Deltaproteobacteria bacterium]|nr:PDZ domain-containing protein [Deltaproteobacteria bacterium]
ESREATARPGNGTAQLGMSVREITPEIVQSLGLSEDNGILIVSVQPGSSADNAGIKKGDIIKEINRKPVTTLSQFNDALKSTHQDNILMLVKRGRTSLWIVVKPQK